MSRDTAKQACLAMSIYIHIHLRTNITETKQPFQNLYGRLEKKYNEEPVLKWSIVRTVPGYSNISKRCLLCLYEKFEILHYSNPENLLNKRSELVSNCRHVNKFLLKNYKSND